MEEILFGDKVRVVEQDTFSNKKMIVYIPHMNLYWIKDMSLEAEVSDNIRVGIDSILFSGSQCGLL